MKLDLTTLSNNIRAYRHDAGMTQADLAFLIGAHQQDITRWESGKREPTLTTLYLIAGALGMDDPTNLLRDVELIDEQNKFVVIDRDLRDGDEYHEFFDTLEEANADAEEQWDKLTASEQEQRHVFVMYGPAEFDGEWVLPESNLDDHEMYADCFDSDDQ